MTTVGELLGIESEAWMSEALCAQIAPDLWFPEQGERTAQVKAICAQCDVRVQCLTFALAHDERHGIWGATSERERRRIRELQSATKRRAA